MTINEIIKHIETQALAQGDVKSFQAGNAWNSATNKGEIYPCAWLEMPILTTYTNRTTKRFTFALNVLMLAKTDDYKDVVNKQSQCEEILDDLLIKLQYQFKNNLGYENISGITLEGFNSDLAVGARADFTVITNRKC